MIRDQFAIDFSWDNLLPKRDNLEWLLIVWDIILIANVCRTSSSSSPPPPLPPLPGTTADPPYLL